MTSVVRVAVLGASGWMGRVHTMAYQTFPHFFGPSHGTAEVVALVEGDAAAAANLGFRAPGARIVDDWREVVEAPDVDLIDICLPDALHHEVAKAAIAAGKHVYCEKPLADTAEQARELADLARATGAITRVGHAFPRNPVHDLAREIGEITLFKACQHIDSYADPTAPYMWRADGALARTGIIGDTGSHVFSFMDFLVGRVTGLVADTYITTAARPVEGSDEMRPVTNPDGANVLCRFENGARGIVDFSRTAMGRKFRQTYEIYGTKGAIAYDYDEVNRLRFYSGDDPEGRRGFREIDVGTENATFAAFLPLPNFALGYNESKIIEVAEVVRSITENRPMWPTFETGHHICQIVDACMDSAASGSWVTIGREGEG